MIELRCGAYQDVLRDVTCDALIFDPPYSKRTADGQRGNRLDGSWLGSTKQSGITYGHLTVECVNTLVASWTPRVRRWFVMFGDDLSVAWANTALRAVGWYAFHAVPWTKRGACPRIGGDGPSPQAEYLAIGRPRRRMYKPELRYRPGWYHGPGARGLGLVGAKPAWIMESLVRDYSEPGDLICDPFAGTGSTLIAAHQLGRRAIGAELDPKTHDKALDRIVQHVLNGDQHDPRVPGIAVRRRHRSEPALRTRLRA